MKSLQEKALLVNLTISQWSARKHDQNVSKKVEQEHNAQNAGRYNKILISDNELKEIQKVAGTVRTFLYDNTLPWGDNGDRLLPATNYFEFINQFNEHQSMFNSAVQKFIMQYPKLIEEARIRLNGMFREDDYPNVSYMTRKFDMHISFMPISSTNDFRLDVDQQEVEKLKVQIESEMHARITSAANSIWVRIKDAVSHMVDKLSDKDAIFRDSLVDNIAELVDLLPRLNFTQDKAVQSAIASMKELLVAPHLLRTNANMRNQKALEAKAILDKVSDFLG